MYNYGFHTTNKYQSRSVLCIVFLCCCCCRDYDHQPSTGRVTRQKHHRHWIRWRSARSNDKILWSRFVDASNCAVLLAAHKHFPENWIHPRSQCRTILSDKNVASVGRFNATRKLYSHFISGIYWRMELIFVGPLHLNFTIPANSVVGFPFRLRNFSVLMLMLKTNI